MSSGGDPLQSNGVVTANTSLDGDVVDDALGTAHAAKRIYPKPPSMDAFDIHEGDVLVTMNADLHPNTQVFSCLSGVTDDSFAAVSGTTDDKLKRAAVAAKTQYVGVAFNNLKANTSGSGPQDVSAQISGTRSMAVTTREPYGAIAPGDVLVTSPPSTTKPPSKKRMAAGSAGMPRHTFDVHKRTHQSVADFLRVSTQVAIGGAMTNVEKNRAWDSSEEAAKDLLLSKLTDALIVTKLLDPAFDVVAAAQRLGLIDGGVRDDALRKDIAEKLMHDGTDATKDIVAGARIGTVIDETTDAGKVVLLQTQSFDRMAVAVSRAMAERDRWIVGTALTPVPAGVDSAQADVMLRTP